MKTINQALTLGLTLVLAACGNKNNNAVPPPPPGQPAPVAPIGQFGTNPQFGASDWVGGQVIPYMQNQYGNLALSPSQNGYSYGASNQPSTVTVAGVAFPMGQFIGWAQMYSIVQDIVRRTPGCTPQNFGSQDPAWNQVNYGCVYQALNAQDYNTLNNTWVRFERTGPTYYMTFAAIFDTLLGSNYSHYSQTQNYNPYTSGQGGYNNGYGYGYGQTGYNSNNTGYQFLGSANTYYNPNAMFQGGFGVSGGSNGTNSWGGNFGGVFNIR